MGKAVVPEGDAEDGIVTYGYQVAQALEYV